MTSIYIIIIMSNVVFLIVYCINYRFGVSVFTTLYGYLDIYYIHKHVPDFSFQTLTIIVTFCVYVSYLKHSHYLKTLFQSEYITLYKHVKYFVLNFE